MRVSRTGTFASSGCIGAATAGLLFLFAASLGADDRDDRGKRNSNAPQVREKNAGGNHEQRRPPAVREDRTPHRESGAREVKRENRPEAIRHENRPPVVRDDNRRPDNERERRPEFRRDNKPEVIRHENRPPVVRDDNRRPDNEREHRPEFRPGNRPEVIRHENRPPVVRDENRRGDDQRDHRPPFVTRENPGPGRPAEVHRDVYRENRPGPVTHGSGRVTRFPNGRIETYRGSNHTDARFHSDGHVRVVRTPERTIYRSSHGSRTVIVQRPGRLIVSHGPRYGYVQRPFVVHNRPYFERTYYRHNVRYVRFYRPYHHRGVTLHVYTPTRYYAPAFYGWAYSPWHRPVVYRWGWVRSPWYGYYGGYFTPYPVYASPALWLTDFIVAATLEAAYQERMAAAEARAEERAAYANNQTQLTPEVKDAISSEVQRQLEAERSEAQNSGANAASEGLPPGLNDNSTHVFVVSRSMDVSSPAAPGGECALTEGDVLQLDAGTPRNADSADVMVLASKANECRKGTRVSVAFEDLTEMQNRMRETIDQGLEELRSKQGQDGLPPLPAAAQKAPVEAEFAAQAPPAENSVSDDLQRETDQANRAEQQVINEASAPEGDASGSPESISLGQTPEEVTAVMGPPEKVIDLGAKQIYLYKNLKVTFKNGTVNDIQ